MREILLIKKAAFLLLALGFAAAVLNIGSNSDHGYVAPDGNDSNDCQSIANACRSVYVALEKLPDGSKSPPTAGHGTIYVYSGRNVAVNCALWNPYRSPAIGLGFMASDDVNYSDPPNGWMHLNGNSISIIGMTADTQSSLTTGGGKSCLTVLGGLPHRILAINGSGLTFQNLAIGGAAQPVTMAYDSAGNNNGGAAGIHFINDAIATAINGSSGPTVKEGQNVFQIYWDDDTLSTDCNQTPGSDAGANILIDHGGPANTNSFANVITNNWWYCGGGVKYYANDGFFTIRVKGLDIEAYGRNVNPGVWFANNGSGGGPCLDCEIEGIELQDYFGPNVIPAVRNDATSGNITVRGVEGYTPGSPPLGGYKNINTQGPMNVIASDYDLNYDSISPLQKGQTGFFNGHMVGADDSITRLFAPAAVRFTNLAVTNMARVTTSGDTTVTTGVLSPDGTTSAATFTSTSGTRYAYLYPQTSTRVSVGDYFIGKVWTTGGNNPLLINAVGTGFGEFCQILPTIAGGDGQWDFVEVVCKVTAAPRSPYYMFLYAQYGKGRVGLYGPVFVHIPSGTLSNNEVYAYAEALTSYDHDCQVGTVCGLHASLNVPGILPGRFTVSGLPSAASQPGLMAHVTDSTSVVTEGQSCTGGGSNHALAFSTGSEWKCF
jgi:hypothetical protein